MQYKKGPILDAQTSQWKTKKQSRLKPRLGLLHSSILVLSM